MTKRQKKMTKKEEIRKRSRNMPRGLGFRRESVLPARFSEAHLSRGVPAGFAGPRGGFFKIFVFFSKKKSFSLKSFPEFREMCF